MITMRAELSGICKHRVGPLPRPERNHTILELDSNSRPLNCESQVAAVMAAIVFGDVDGWFWWWR